MASSAYRFVTHWRVPGTAAEVFQILEAAEDLPRWWPAVWLGVEVLDPGDAVGIGKRTRMHSKGWLPYTLTWVACTLEKRCPDRIVLEASGDFAGSGVWTIRQDGPNVEAVYEWTIQAEKPLLRYLSFALKPIFAANHRWAMQRGEESLQLELARRHAATPEAAARVPAPPGPTFVRRQA